MNDRTEYWEFPAFILAFTCGLLMSDGDWWLAGLLACGVLAFVGATMNGRLDP